MEQIHYIGGVRVQNPVNYPDLFLQVQRDSDGLTIGSSIKTFEWVDAEAAIILKAFNAGMTGGQGVTSGLPHKIDIVENSLIITILNGYIDLQTASFDKDLVTVETIPIASIAWLDSGVADGLSFEYLYKNDAIFRNSQISVPYVISSIPNSSEVMIVSLTSTFVIVHLINQVKQFGKYTGEAPTLIDTAGAVIGLIAEILYCITLIISLIALIVDLVRLIIQKVKYKPAISLNAHFEAACRHLGLKYDSPVLQTKIWNKAHIIPASYSNPESSEKSIIGFLKPDPQEQSGNYKGSFGDLIRQVRTLLNVKVKFNGVTLQIVPENEVNAGTRFTLPSYYNPRFETNAADIISNYLVSFAYDVSDKNTIDFWTGTNVQVSLEHKQAPADKKLSLLKGLEERQSSFARGIKKTELTNTEKAVSALFKVIAKPLGALVKAANAVVDIINAALDVIEKLIKGLGRVGIDIPFKPERPKKLPPPAIGTKISNRIGMLALEQDLFTIDKLVMLDVNSKPVKTKLAIENATILNAEIIFKVYHSSNSFAPSNNSAQLFTYQYENVQMNLTDFKNVQEDGYVKLPNGSVCNVVSLEYNPYERIGNFVIEERKLYTNNLLEKIIVPKGR
tara:strand:- start:3839 stop:5698 length:1860 start_codon:yes stop_codon:yes gene_type:complete